MSVVLPGLLHVTSLRQSRGVEQRHTCPEGLVYCTFQGCVAHGAQGGMQGKRRHRGRAFAGAVPHDLSEACQRSPGHDREPTWLPSESSHCLADGAWQRSTA